MTCFGSGGPRWPAGAESSAEGARGNAVERRASARPAAVAAQPGRATRLRRATPLRLARGRSAARAELIRNGVDASEVFHDAGGGYNPFDSDVRASGPDPQRRSYLSFVTFRDPDGNGWLLQEVTTRLPGRIDHAETALPT